MRLRKRKLKRYMFPAIALAFSLLWLFSTALLWSNWRIDQQRIETTLRHGADSDLHGKVVEIEGILQQTYQVIRTISLLPGVRSTTPGNRNSDEEDIVGMGRMSEADYNTVQQLYNHIASAVEVSEIYIVYDGFDPTRGQVPFVMFDRVIVESFEELTQAHLRRDDPDIPEEDESEEYEDYVRQLNYLREHNFFMPNQTLDGIPPINSGLLRTCDNTQYLSKSRGDVRHSYGFTVSVPIYGIESRQFKGLVTAILRSNVLEAALIGWPKLPVTAADRRELESLRNVDLATPPVNFLLEEQTSGIRINDSRNLDFTSVRETAAYHVETKLELSGPGNWVLHNYVPRASLDTALGAARNNAIAQIGAVSLVLILLWLAVYAVLKEQRKTATQLRQLADIDPLTGLPNRRMIGMYMGEILKATRSEQFFAVIMVDLDDFKQVNDNLGHEAGDRMLIEIGHRFNRTLRNEDHVLRISVSDHDSDEADQTLRMAERVVGRLGGDEFLVILGNLPDAQIASSVAGRLMASLDEPIEIGIEKIYSRVSMGIAVYPSDGEDAAALLRSADIALYEAKRCGRGQAVIYTPELNADAMLRFQMMAALHEAIQEQQFFLVYQPELHVGTGKINAAEALLRWQHPEFGLVMPYHFIPMLEGSGLIIEVGRWILQTACRQFKTWVELGLPMQVISVNISPKQLAQPDFADMVADILTDTGIRPQNLVLEVTESIFMDQSELAIQSLTEVRELGVSVAIDDFGTGYSSLSYLRKIPLDILKIDRSFVKETDTANGVAICDMLIALSDRLGLKVVAEGIETQQQMERLHQADWIQGYFIARPQTPEDFIKTTREFSLLPTPAPNHFHQVRKLP